MNFGASRRAARLVCAGLLVTLGTLLATWVVSGQDAPGNTGPSVARIYYDSIADLEGLAGYDLWEVNNTAEKYVLASISPQDYDMLTAAGWRLERDAAATGSLQRSAGQDLFVDGYRTVDELYADLEALAQDYPELSELVVYGQSECLAAGGCLTPGDDALPGYDLRALRVTNEAVPGASVISETDIVMGEKPVLFLIANIHAREITTPELAMRMADWLLEGYGVNADATWLVDWHEIWIVPTANPDGHWLVELGATPPYGNTPFFHRKNANQDADADGMTDCDQWPSSSFSQYGVDLNRNHTFGWDLPGSSLFPCDLTYRGPAAGSELEVSSLETLVSALIADQRGPGLEDPAPMDTSGLFITLHSYSNLVLWPWGGLYEDAPNRDGLKAIGDKLASFNGYLSCQPTDCLYAASGASDDWAYGTLGIPAFTFEVGDEFMPDYSAIDAVQWPDNRPAFIYAARIARAPYQTVLGPDAMQATAVLSDDLAVFQVTFNELDTGGDPIAGGEFSIDRPLWDDQSEPVAMAAVDGSFESVVELAYAQVPVATLDPGRHIVYFRGRDSEGNWGAVTATFFDIQIVDPAEAVLIPILISP